MKDFAAMRAAQLERWLAADYGIGLSEPGYSAMLAGC